MEVMGDRRQRFARRRREGGGSATFAGIFVAGLFVILGAICLLMNEVPVGTRRGVIWLDGFHKNCFAYCFFCVAAALNLGLVWSRVASLKYIAPAGALIATLAAVYFFYATLA